MSFKFPLILSFLIIAFLVSTVSGQGFLKPKKQQGSETTKMQQGVQRYTVHTYSDQYSDGWAFRLLIPEGWLFEGGIKWLPQAGKLAEVHFAVSDPRGNAAMEVMPDYFYWWGNNAYTIQQMQAAGMPVAQPMTALQLLENYVLPNIRGNVQNLQVVNRTNLPVAAQELTAAIQRQQQVDQCLAALTYGTSSSYDVAQIDVTYSNGGVLIFERLMARVLYVNNQMQGTLMWGPDRTVSFRTVMNEKEANFDKFVAMYSSLTENPVFLAKLCQVNQMLVDTQRQISQNAAELSGYLSRTANEISDIVAGAYRYKSAADDRVFDNWSEYTRGLRTFTDNEIEIKIPLTAESVWRNGSTIVFSSQPGFNPHQVLRGSWTPMDQK